MSVAYLTVRTADGDAIFEVDGLGPPELHARLSRVLQGLQRRKSLPAPIELERAGRVAAVPQPPAEGAVEPIAAAPLVPEPHTPLDIDAERTDAPLEVLVIDALWKLARLRDAGLLDDGELGMLRTRLLARVAKQRISPSAPVPGPLLHV